SRRQMSKGGCHMRRALSTRGAWRKVESRRRTRYRRRMRSWVGLVVVCLFGVGLGCNKKEAGPRPDPTCHMGPEVSLREFCDQDNTWRDKCERYAHYDDGLAAMIVDCGATGFPVAVGSCDLRVVERSLGGTSGELFYYDEDGDLVGIRTFED